jgi:membrane-associated phospholipid phosphatase
MIGLLARRKHLFLLLIYPLVGFGFFYLKTFNTSPTFLMEWPMVDRAIPFVPWMIGPYFFWYLAVAFPFLWLGLRDGPGFTRYCWYIYAGMTSTYVLYLFFPNGQNLRPVLDSLSGWDIDAVRWLYAHDAPRNVNPSLHVIDTLAVWFALGRDQTLGSRRWFRTVLTLVCLAIISSTVLVKQHSILDVFGGVAWSAVWYGLIYSRWSPFFRREELSNLLQ